jgi:hypothetical protein
MRTAMIELHWPATFHKDGSLNDLSSKYQRIGRVLMIAAQEVSIMRRKSSAVDDSKPQQLER